MSNYLFKISLLGEQNVGKTALMNRFVNDTYIEFFLSALNDHSKTKNIKVEDHTIKLNILDADFSSRFRKTNSDLSELQRGSSAYFICYDITDEQSFQVAKERLESTKKYQSGTAKFVLIGTKSDLISERETTFEEANLFAQNNDMTYFETSAKENINCNDAFEATAQILLQEKQSKLQRQNAPAPFSEQPNPNQNNYCCVVQ